MASNYEIDDLDRKILTYLQEDARMPYLDIARKLIVSGGTIHQRMDRLKKHGYIKGSHLEVDLQKMGLDVSVFLGVHLASGQELNVVIEKMKALKEITEVHYTTGNYALLIKVTTKSIQDFHRFLVEKLQNLDEVRATESFVILDSPVVRQPKI